MRGAERRRQAVPEGPPPRPLTAALFHTGACSSVGCRAWGRRCQRRRRAAGERLPLMAKGHFAPGSVGDSGSMALPARLVPSPFLICRDELLSPFQVMPKPRRRPWPGTVPGHPSCCGSPCSCSSTRAVSGVHPAPQPCAPHCPCAPSARPSCPDRPWPQHAGAAAGGWERRRRHGWHWQDGAWRVPAGLPNARSSSPAAGGPVSGKRHSSLRPA